MKEFTQKAEFNNLSLTASFSGDKDVLLNALDYASMSKYIDFMQFTASGKNHISDSLTMINRLIELDVPLKKIVIGILKFGGNELYRANIMSRNTTPKPTPKINIQTESARSIANVVRFCMKRNVAGFMIFGVNNYEYNCQPEFALDTFADFKPASGISLKFPPRNDYNYPLLATINAAINVTLEEIKQENEIFSSK